MAQEKQKNRRIVLVSRPQGAPTPANFRLELCEALEPALGQVQLRSVYLSLDPYMRGRMRDEPSYAPPVGIGDVMVGGVVRLPRRMLGDTVHRTAWLGYRERPPAGMGLGGNPAGLR